MRPSFQSKAWTKNEFFFFFSFFFFSFQFQFSFFMTKPKLEEKLLLKHLHLTPLANICLEYLDEPGELWVLFDGSVLWSLNLCDSQLKWTRKGPHYGKLEFDNWLFDNKARTFLLTSEDQLFYGTLDEEEVDKEEIVFWVEDRKIPYPLVDFVENARFCVLNQNIWHFIGRKGFETQAVRNFPCGLPGGCWPGTIFENLSFSGLGCEWMRAGWCHDALHNRIYRFGGEHCGLSLITSSSSWISLTSASLKTWTSISSSLTLPRTFCSAALHPQSQKIFVSGGRDRSFQQTQSIEVFDLQNQCFIWRKQKRTLPIPLSSHYSFCWQNWLFICGGCMVECNPNKSIWKRKLNRSGQFLGDWSEVHIVSDPLFDKMDPSNFLFA